MNTLKSRLSKIFALIALGLLPVISANAYQFKIDGGTSKDLIPQQRLFAEVAPQNNYQQIPGDLNSKYLSVTAWVDHKSKKNRPPVYRLGDSVQFFVEANKNCYITLLDIGTTGKTQIIFPNNFQRNNYIKAGDTIVIPQKIDNFDFKVTGKRGKEVIKVIATMERIEIVPQQYLISAGSYKQIRTKDISVVATGVSSLLKNKEWAEYTKIISIR